MAGPWKDSPVSTLNSTRDKKTSPILSILKLTGFSCSPACYHFLDTCRCCLASTRWTHYHRTGSFLAYSRTVTRRTAARISDGFHCCISYHYVTSFLLLVLFCFLFFFSFAMWLKITDDDANQDNRRPLGAVCCPWIEVQAFGSSPFIASAYFWVVEFPATSLLVSVGEIWSSPMPWFISVLFGRLAKVASITDWTCLGTKYYPIFF